MNYVTNFASAGSSMGMSSGDAPDSICPRGWILATYDGNKSYKNLIIDVYGRENANPNRDTGILYLPLSFLRSGNYNYSNGNKDNRGSDGYYWESRIASATYSNYLYFNSARLGPQNGTSRGHGFSVRCLSH